MTETRLEVDVEPWLLWDNEAAPAPGLVLVDGRCDVCRTRHRWGLPLGRFAIDHDHDGWWQVRQLAVTAAEPANVAANQ